MHCKCILFESLYKTINCTFSLLMKKGPKITDQAKKIKMQNATQRVQGSRVQFNEISIHLADKMYIAKCIPNLVSNNHKNSDHILAGPQMGLLTWSKSRA